MTSLGEGDEGLARRLLPRLLLSALLGGAFAWLASRGGVPLIPSSEELATVEPWTVPVYVASLLVVHLLRATRWRFLIAPVKQLPLREVILLNWIGFFAIFALPFRLGEIARPALTKLRHGIPVSVGIGTVAVERVLDGLITSVCVGWALFVLPRLPTTDPAAQLLPAYGYLAWTFFLAAYTALALFLWQRKLAVRMTEMFVGLVSPKLAAFAAEKVSNVADGVRSIGQGRLALGFLFETLLYWSVNALGVMWLARGCGLPLSLGHAAAVMGVLAIGILLPTGPGLFGNFQLAVTTTLKLYLLAPLVVTRGAVFVFWLYVCQASVMIIAGVVPLLMLRLRLRDLLVVKVDRSALAAGETDRPRLS